MTDRQLTGAELDARIAKLTDDIPPDAALWSAIAQQLGPAEEQAAQQADVRVEERLAAPQASVSIAPASRTRASGSSWYELATAAVFAAATAAFIVWGQLAPSFAPDVVLARVAPFEMNEQHGGELIRVRQQLHNKLRHALQELSPTTRVVVVENLARIELARVDIASALEKEPGNLLLEKLLLTSYTNELTLLNEFTGLAQSAQQRTRL